MSWLDKLLNRVTGSGAESTPNERTDRSEMERLRRTAEKLARDHGLELRSDE